MVRKIFLILLGFLIFFLVFKSRTPRSTTAWVKGKPLSVTIAKTAQERERGLSEKVSLCWDCGMLFLFDKEGIYPFWMRKMYFDIDIIWIKDGEIVDITYRAKKPSAEEFEAPKDFYTSRTPVDKVLEVNAGWCEKNGVKIGDKVEIW